MRIVVDSSTLISLAWSGQLQLLALLPLQPVVIRSVYVETVTNGRARGYADAISIEQALSGVEPVEDPDAMTIDGRVLAMATEVGVLVANDVVLGRRASNLGARWLRTADLVILGLATGAWDGVTARRAIDALADTGRITADLRDAYTDDIADVEVGR